MKFDVEVGLGPGHIVLDGHPAPPAQKGHSPQFSAHVCCDQTAGWINIPLGTEVDHGPGDIVLYGDPAPPKKGHSTPNFVPCMQQPPLFGPCVLWSNGRPSQLLLSSCLS